MGRYWWLFFIIINLISVPTLAGITENSQPIVIEKRWETPVLPTPVVIPPPPSSENCPPKFQRRQKPSDNLSLWLPMFCREYYQAPDFSGVAGLPAGQPLLPIIICQDPLDPEKFEDKTGLMLNYQIDDSIVLMMNNYWQLIISPQQMKDSDRHTWLTIVMILELYSLNGQADKPDWWGCLRSDDQTWLRGARPAIRVRFNNRIDNLQKEIHLLFD